MINKSSPRETHLSPDLGGLGDNFSKLLENLSIFYLYRFLSHRHSANYQRPEVIFLRFCPQKLLPEKLPDDPFHTIAVDGAADFLGDEHTDLVPRFPMRADGDLKMRKRKLFQIIFWRRKRSDVHVFSDGDASTPSGRREISCACEIRESSFASFYGAEKFFSRCVPLSRLRFSSFLPHFSGFFGFFFERGR